RTIHADNADRLARLHGKADVLQHPGFLVPLAPARPLPSTHPLAGIALVGFAYARHGEYGAVHSSSTITPARARKKRAPAIRNNPVSTINGSSCPRAGTE